MMNPSEKLRACAKGSERPPRSLHYALWVSSLLHASHFGTMLKSSQAPPHRKTHRLRRGPRPPAGLLPVPDYSGNFLTRQFLTGDWGGIRTNLANHGVQIGVEWDQFVQGVTKRWP